MRLGAVEKNALTGYYRMVAEGWFNPGEVPSTKHALDKQLGVISNVTTDSRTGEAIASIETLVALRGPEALRELVAKAPASEVNRALDIIASQKANYGEPITAGLLTPKEIHQHLDEYVVGQEHAKKVLSVAVRNHQKRTRALDAGATSVPIEKSNVLLVGPSGTGKTLLVETLASVTGVPFAAADVTTLTAAGYVGKDVESVLTDLLAAAKGNMAEAERGIVFLDEVDKLTMKADSGSSRDVGGESVQDGLLKLLQGCEVDVPVPGARGGGDKRTVKMDTRNILFICAGAFSGIESIVQSRKHTKSGIGFGATVRAPVAQLDQLGAAKELRDLMTDDLIKAGLKREFVGRLAVIAPLAGHDIKGLESILTEPKNALLKQFQAIFELEDIKLRFTPDAITTIAQIAYDRQTGARGLRSVMESALLQLMYDPPGKGRQTTITIDGDYIRKVVVDGDLSAKPHVRASAPSKAARELRAKIHARG